MRNAIKRIAAAAASMSVALSGFAGMSQLTASAAYGQGGNGTAIMEYLDRGIYAIKSGNGMFISWRYNANDADESEFRLYRDNQLIYTSKAGQATNYWDAYGSSNSVYRVDTYVYGVLKSSETSNFTSGSNYFDIPLNNPDSSKYSPNDCCVGDVDGDGQYEIFLKWDPNDSQDNSKTGYTSKVYIDCYTLKGKQLWRIDMGKNIRAGQHYTQMCVADFDCDGKAELITKTCDGTIDGTGSAIGNAYANYVDSSGTVLTGPEYLTLFEGATGKALDTIDFPVPRGTATGNTAKSTWGDNYGNRCERYNAAIAYLDGVHPSAVYGRGYYTRLSLSAVDVRNGKLVKRWVYDSGFNTSDPAYGQGNHNVMVADFDNDGKQEVCMGASCFDDNGSLLWTTRQGHGDAMHVGDLDPNHEGIEVFLCHESGSYGISLIDGRNGNKIWHYDGDKDTGRCCADNILAGNGSAEFWGSRPAGAVYNAQGQQIATKQPSTNFLIYWDGDLERELLDNIYITKATAANNYQTIFTADGCASNNGTKAVPCLTADLFGDWREELVLRTEDNSRLRIFCTNTETSVRMTTLMHDMQYRMQNGCQQSSYNQPPHTSYYLGSDAAVPGRPNIKLNNTPPEPVNGTLVKNFLVKDSANADGWKLMSSNTTGGLIYGDRDFTYTSLASDLQNCEYIMTACNSKNTDADLAEFTADKDMEVYVMVDDRETSAGMIPYWLSGYTKTSLTASSSNDVTFTAYKKEFNAGDKVVLGTNGMTGYVVNYTVFVKEKSQPNCPPPNWLNIRVNYNTQYHQIQFVWDKADGADRYGIAVYLAGKWRVQTSNITTNSYVTPKNLTPGMTYKVAIAARVNGKWDTMDAIKNYVTVTVR
ncbi:MAG: rhamnogalacturonan lyase [Ruminococcus sp.]|uniref:rhamnogalacturonan lyase n=1 Tax=Ruminococcus sp. TaxID=41978 RepID=UPI0025E3EF81|nr:rhamnogalacturonan lyase [Ruminococcus sp.]MBO4866172.1 rhamnogalacturonan lyase [Ruminococcus sp.]